MSNVNIYSACDRAIKEMNRESLEEFTRLKGMAFDKINIIRIVKAVYSKLTRFARERYYEVAFEAYVLGLIMCDVDPKKAHKMAEKAITGSWIDHVLAETDFIVRYKFNSEAERKAYRLAEALEIPNKRAQEIDKALKAWSQQTGQFAINVTDYAILDAFMDAGVKEVRWVSEADQRVCHNCHSMDGKTYGIDEIPTKPHPGCRCRIVPVKESVSHGNAV